MKTNEAITKNIPRDPERASRNRRREKKTVPGSKCTKSIWTGALNDVECANDSTNWPKLQIAVRYRTRVESSCRQRADRTNGMRERGP